MHGDFRPRSIIESLLDPIEEADPILSAAIFTMSGERMIIGLPAVSAQRIWVVPALKDDEFWFIDQDIYFM